MTKMRVSSDSKVIYHFTKDFYAKYMLLIFSFFKRTQKKQSMVPPKILSSTTDFVIIDKFWRIIYVKLKTVVMAAENTTLPLQEYSKYNIFLFVLILHNPTIFSVFLPWWTKIYILKKLLTAILIYNIIVLMCFLNAILVSILYKK